jgi:AcrR family transcriptional regulator
VVADVLTASVRVLGHTGYAALRIDDVADEAGVNKTTIYRRWPTRAALVIAALDRLVAPPRTVESGDLAHDLAATMRTATSLRTTRVGRGVLRVLIAEHGNAEVAAVLATIRERHRGPVRRLVRRAQQDDRLAREASADLIVDVLFGAVYDRLRITGRPIGRAWLDRVVRLVLSGADRAPTPSRADS